MVRYFIPYILDIILEDFWCQQFSETTIYTNIAYINIGTTWQYSPFKNFILSSWENMKLEGFLVYVIILLIRHSFSINTMFYDKVCIEILLFMCIEKKGRKYAHIRNVHLMPDKFTVYRNTPSMVDQEYRKIRSFWRFKTFLDIETRHWILINVFYHSINKLHLWREYGWLNKLSEFGSLWSEPWQTSAFYYVSGTHRGLYKGE